MINGVNEGLAGIGVAFLLTAWFGPEFWKGELIFGLQVSHFVVLVLMIMAVFTAHGK